MTRIEAIQNLLSGAAVRILGLWYIRDVELAIARWQLQADGPAVMQLHQSLRRLHVVLRSFGAELNGSVSRKRVRELAALVRCAQAALRATTSLQAAEQIGLSTEGDEPGHAVMQRLETKRTRTYEDMPRVGDAFADLAQRWKATLGTYKLQLDADVLPCFEDFRAVAVRQASHAAHRLEQALSYIEMPDEFEELHKGRRAAERLAVLLEPLRMGSPALPDSLRALQQLQGLLTSIEAANDILVVATAGGAGDESAWYQSAVQKRAREYFDLRRVWLEGNSKWFFQRLRHAIEITSRLEAAR